MSPDQTRREFIATAAAASLPALVPETAARHILHASLAPRGEPASSIDDDLLEVTIARLGELYTTKKYTVSQVTRWYLDRIAKYDGVYRALIHVGRLHLDWNPGGLQDGAAHRARGGENQWCRTAP